MTTTYTGTATVPGHGHKAYEVEASNPHQARSLIRDLASTDTGVHSSLIAVTGARTTTTPDFDPNTNSADAFAVISDTAPMEFWADFAEDTALVRRVILVRDYLRTRDYNPNLTVLRDTTLALKGTNR